MTSVRAAAMTVSKQKEHSDEFQSPEINENRFCKLVISLRLVLLSINGKNT